MTYGRKTYRPRTAPSANGALVSPRQAAALDTMATANGFANGSALLADVASCSVAELGRQPRSVVQMFVDRAFARYGKAGRPARHARALRRRPLLRLLRLVAAHLALWALGTYAGNVTTCGLVAFAWLWLCWRAGQPDD